MKRGRTSPLRRLVSATRERARRVVGRGMARSLRWLPPQEAFHRDEAHIKLLRLGNQWGGKTTAGLAEVDWHCTGRHPYHPVRPPPVEWWIVCASWAQSVAIQAKFWALCSRDELDDRTVFDPVKGFRGKSPVVRYRNGSIVRFKTTRQGGLQLAGATVHGVLIDEPTEQRIFGELRKRLLKTAGYLFLTLTPINGPVDYLRDLAQAGAISDHHYALRPEYLVPIGASAPLTLDDGTPMDAAWIEQIRSETLPHEAPIVIDGEWEVRAEGNTFRAFDTRTTEGRHIREALPDRDLRICLGVDFGERTFKQIAVLVAVDVSAGDEPAVHVLDERVGDGLTTAEQDAEAILGMLEDWGLSWYDLHTAYGDRPHDGPRLGRKGIKELSRAVAKVLKKRGQLRGPVEIRQAKTGIGGGKGAVHRGCAWLHRAMVAENRFTIRPRCVRLIESFQKWAWQDDDWKDPIDALRYALWPYAMRGVATKTRNNIYLY